MGARKSGFDFDTVIVTSMNEGSFQQVNPKFFIPYDVKRELGYLLLRKNDLYVSFLPFVATCQNIYLLYNTESDGLDAGEKSRFITQLEVEKNNAINLTHEIYNAVLP
jgi:hypothetical protein